MDADEKLLEVWKKTVEVQQHFNELAIRIRSIAITVLGAFLAAAGFTMKEDLKLTLAGIEMSLTTFLLLAASICWMCFYAMDRHWYHRLLRGAVSHGLFLEKSVEKTFPELGLTKAIGEASPIVVGGQTFNSDRKMAYFYWTICILLLLGVVATIFNHPKPKQPAVQPPAAAATIPPPPPSRVVVPAKGKMETPPKAPAAPAK